MRHKTLLGCVAAALFAVCALAWGATHKPDVTVARAAFVARDDAPVLLGDTNVEATKDGFQGSSEAFGYTASRSGTATDANVYLDSTSGVTLGLYADDDNRPGALLDSGAVSSNTPGWVSVALSQGVHVAAGTQYWIAIYAGSDDRTIGYRDSGNGGSGLDYSGAGIQDPYRIAHQWSSNPASVYIAGTPSSSPGTTTTSSTPTTTTTTTSSTPPTTTSSSTTSTSNTSSSGGGGGGGGGGAVPCALTHAAGADGTGSCWAQNTGVQGATGYSEAQIKAGAPGFTYVNGNVTLSTNGATIDHEWINGCVSIRANNVTIKDSLITVPDGDYCEGGDDNSAASGVNNGLNGTTGTLIEDTTVDGQNSTGNQFGVSIDNGQVLRVNSFGFAKNFYTGGGTSAAPALFEGDYSHDLSVNSCAGYPGGCTTPAGGASAQCAHDNGFYMNSSDYFTIEDSYSIMTGAGYCVTGAITNLADYGTPHDFTVERSYMEGDTGADLYTGKDSSCGTPNVVITDNAFSSDNGYSGTDYVNYWTPSGNTFSGNYIAETGTPFINPPISC